MSKYGNGLLSVEYGTIANDGGVAAAFTPLGDTMSGSASLATAAGTTTDFNIEESDDPVLSIVKKGTATVKWSCLNVEADTLIALFGGTKSGAGTIADPVIYKAPDVILAKELSLRFTDGQGTKITIVRASVFPVFNWALSKDKVAQIDITATILKPTKANTPSYSITYPGVG